MEQDAHFMRLALHLGRRGLGRTSPNPPVGAVVVKSGKVIGRGYHHAAGLPHAEIEALRDAGARGRGATLYVTLEPCNHHGRTPPCTLSLIEAGVRRVVFGSRDPNPKVAGNGLRRLRAAGIEVTAGVEQAACDELIAAFRKHAVEGLPLVTLKLAASLDGRIATRSGDSQWITSAESRRHVHRLRNENDAILVGAQTVIQDDPRLTCRIRGGRNPVRLVLDGRLRIPLDARLIVDRRAAPTIVVTGHSVSQRKVSALRARGVDVWQLPDRRGVIAWRPLLRRIAARDLASLLIEGGAAVAAGALHAGIVDQVLLFYAPKLIGGDGRPMLGNLGVDEMHQAFRLGTPTVSRLGDDLLVSAVPIRGRS
jgi:diaminohydroxyphosphoribosylaminopyrimidine deaminase/5-amino-6-(5-phosphoribosylamino)uracil reductase